MLFTKLIIQLGIHRSMHDLAVYSRKVDGIMVTLNLSTYDVLVCTDSPLVRTKIESHLRKYFPITTKHGKVLEYLNYCIIQSDSHVTVDQIDHIIKMTTAYFSKAPFKKKDIPFHTDRTVEDGISNAQSCVPTAMKALDDKHGECSSTHGSINHVSMCSRPDMSYSTTRLGCFLTVPCALGCALFHKSMCYLQSHPNKPLIFLKNRKISERVLRAHWSANKSDHFTFENSLETFQDAGYG